MTTRGRTYAEHFRSKSAASEYERLYKGQTADDAFWQIERSFLTQLIQNHSSRWPNFSYLDFACGTGRVLQFVEQFASRSRGIDVSPEMLSIAASKTTKSELVCADITAMSDIEGSYDLITAFRFFLNTEPRLRVEVMKGLARRLRNRDSLLVFNNHGNPWSYKALAWPIHKLRQIGAERNPTGHCLTHGQVKRLLTAAELQIVDRLGYGFVSPKIHRVAHNVAARVESLIAGFKLIEKCGVSQLYVVAKDGAQR